MRSGADYRSIKARLESAWKAVELIVLLYVELSYHCRVIGWPETVRSLTRAGRAEQGDALRNDWAESKNQVDSLVKFRFTIVEELILACSVAGDARKLLCPDVEEAG